MSVDTRTRRARRLAARQTPVAEAPASSPDDPSPEPSDTGKPDGDDPTLAEIGVPQRYRDDLEGAGITTLSELKAFGDLTAINGIGPKSAREIEEAVAAFEAART